MEMEFKIGVAQDRYEILLRRNKDISCSVILNKHAHISDFVFLRVQRSHCHLRLLWQGHIFIHYITKAPFKKKNY
jgi:hypothetical protein